MNHNFKKINLFLFSKEKKSMYLYMAANVLAIAITFLINYFLTKWVSPMIYGKYKYAISLILTIPTFIDFGIHFSCSRIVANEKSNERNPIVLLSFLIILIVSIIVTILLMLTIYLDFVWDFNYLSKLFDVRIILPFLSFFTIKLLFFQLYQGTGKINELSVLTIVQNLLVFLGIVILNSLNITLQFDLLIYLYIFANILVLFPTLIRINYKEFFNIKFNFPKLLNDVRTNSFLVYLSTILSTGTSAIIALITGSIYGFAEYGYYSLALSFAHGFTFIASAVSVVTFKENVNKQFIKPSNILFMIIINSIVYITFLIFIDPIFNYFFSVDYVLALNYLKILALAYILNGFIIVFNRFFIATGKGKIIFWNSLRVAIFSVVLSAILIPLLGMQGVIITTLLTSSFNLIQYIVMYKIIINKNRYATSI